MLALYFDGKLRLGEQARPQSRPGEVLIRVTLAGVCGTDLQILKGYHHFKGIMGHEFVGVVEGPVDSPWLGQRVVGEINIPCGVCPRCRRGLSRHCLQRQVIGLKDRDGAFASYLALPEANLHPSPPGLPDEAAVFTEPLAAALAVTEVAPHIATSRVLVIGDRTLGLLASGVLALHGAEVHLAGHYPEHLDLAKHYGVITFLEKDLPRENQDYDLVVEASGSPSGLALALKQVRPQGTVVLKSTYVDHYPLNPADLVVPEVKLTGSRCGPFPGALRLLSQGWIDPRPLIARRFPLAQGLEAINYAGQAGILKVLIDCGGGG